MALARGAKGDGDPVQAMGRAKDGAIVVFISAQRFPTLVDGTLEAVEALVTEAIETALNEVGGMAVPEARLCVVYDRSNSPSVWTEVDYFRAIGAVLEANYPETLQRAFVFPTGGAFRWGWKMAQAFINDDTRSKLLLCTEQDLEANLAEHIDPTVLGTGHLG